MSFPRWTLRMAARSVYWKAPWWSGKRYFAERKNWTVSEHYMSLSFRLRELLIRLNYCCCFGVRRYLNSVWVC